MTSHAGKTSAAVATTPPSTPAALIAQDGCDRFCAYCIVPRMRGAPTSVPMGALLRAAAERFAQGFREIVLTGCNLALYRDPDTGAALPELLARLCDVPGEGRFRLGSLEPCVTDDAALFRLAAGSGGAPLRLLPSAHPVRLRRAARADGAALRRRADPRHAGRALRGAAVLRSGRRLDRGPAGRDGGRRRGHAPFAGRLSFHGRACLPVFQAARDARRGVPRPSAPERIATRAAALRAVAAETRRLALRRFLGRELCVIPERTRTGRCEGWSAEYLRCRLPESAPRGVPTAILPDGTLG